jgi:UDP-glucuronate 4-epimerase
VKYLVTGAAGFIGSHLSQLLLEREHEVVALDNFNEYYSSEFKRKRINEILEPLGLSVRNVDLCVKDSVNQLIRKERPDVVVHLAGQPGVRTPLEQSHLYVESNLVAFCNVLEACTANEVPNFLYASSSSVYGDSLQLPYSEGNRNLAPVSIYGATKLAGEILAPSYVRGSKTKTRGMRFFTVYGPWGRPDMAYFRLINSGLNQMRFDKFGDGNIKRDFTYISDITNMILRLSLELVRREDGFSDIVNIGGGNPHSLNDLIEAVEKILEVTILVDAREQNSNDSKITCADTTKLEALTGSKPQIDLETGLSETVKWAKSIIPASELDKWIRSTN